MKSLGLFTQLGVIIVSIVIGVFYVQPTFVEIGEIQTDISSYDTERKKIQAINAQLASNVATLESIRAADKQNLVTYMPRLIDDIAILRDLEFMISTAGLNYNSLSYEGKVVEKPSFTEEANSSIGDNLPTQHSFNVDVRGEYENIKTFMRILEQNEYPLEIHNMSLSANESGEMTATFTLVTYIDELVLVSDNL